jgi:hypothetical protein
LNDNPNPSDKQAAAAAAHQYKNQLARLGAAIKSIFGEDTPWVLAILPDDSPGTLSCSNLPVEDQIEVLKGVLSAFGDDRSFALKQVKFDPVAGKPIGEA